eukprot:CAMPEP_0178988730 /NCGR_PEP_ID=MMETSP0795-20121207/3965_1 /TAXON_ID=88552 /ORGANISM="Amoebophrya sp., Strain Ameob2" /LENGTH=776 /DNA_ID=CAMNT_0020680021 /DNA_START=87 /DNA_END=2418 /DNA_ORIENTATION=+
MAPASSPFDLNLGSKVVGPGASAAAGGDFDVTMKDLRSMMSGGPPAGSAAGTTGGPTLRPQVGFCMKARIRQSVDKNLTSVEGSRMYLNFCTHPLIEAPRLPNGKTVTKEWILKHGIGNMQIPLDLGTYRKLKLAAEGGKSSFAVDVVFHPSMIELFMNEDFNSSKLGFAGDQLNSFRPYLSNVAFNMVERELKLQLSRAEKEISLVKDSRYMDPENAGKKSAKTSPQPREFQEIMTEEAVAEMKKTMEDRCGIEKKEEFGKNIKFKDAPAGDHDMINIAASEKGANEDFLIRESSTGQRGVTTTKQEKGQQSNIKKQMKGFLNKAKEKNVTLYDENGSGEGVLPENAGDPMGWLPKKLRNTCQIVDTNTPEYQEKEKQRLAAEQAAKENEETKSDMMKDMERWAAKQRNTYDRWAEDVPTNASSSKYDLDYSKFDRILQEEEAADARAGGQGGAAAPGAITGERDWYYDAEGKPHPVKKGGKSSSAGAGSSSSSSSAATSGRQGTANGSKPALSGKELDEFKGLAKGWFDNLGKDENGNRVTAPPDGISSDALIDGLKNLQEAGMLDNILGADGKFDPSSHLAGTGGGSAVGASDNSGGLFQEDGMLEAMAQLFKSADAASSTSWKPSGTQGEDAPSSSGLPAAAARQSGADPIESGAVRPSPASRGGEPVAAGSTFSFARLKYDVEPVVEAGGAAPGAFKVTVRECARPKEITLDATERELILQFDGGKTRIPLCKDSSSDKKLDIDGITAKASAKKQTLIVTVPLLDPIGDMD